MKRWLPYLALLCGCIDGQGSDGSGPNIEHAQQLYCPTPGRRRGEG